MILNSLRTVMLGVVFLFPALSAVTAEMTEASRALPVSSAELYVTTNVWTVHLKFTPDQWEAMEPEASGPGGFGGRPPGPPGGQRPNGDRLEFGPGMVLAPAFMKDGDKDHDSILSPSEFAGLAEQWFNSWDKAQAGQLNREQLSDGLNSTLLAGGPPGGMQPGRGPGLILQGPQGKRNGLASAMGIEFDYAQADVDFEGQAFRKVGVRYKGNGTFMQSRGSLKRSLKLDLNRFVKGQKLGGVTKLNLHNNVTDASWMNEALSYQLYRQANVPAPRSSYARVYLTVPGKYDREYLGLYSLVEDVDKEFAEDRFGTKKGAIFKPVTPNLFAELGSDWSAYTQTYDPKTEVTPKETQRILELCRLVTKANDADFAENIGRYIDLDQFPGFMAVMVWLSDLDGILGPGQNFYLFLHPKTEKLTFIPWDQDHAFGQFAMRGTQEQREHLSIHKPWQGANPFLEKVFRVEAFKKPYLDRLQEFNKTIFGPSGIAEQIEELATVLRPAVKEESAEKLERFEKVVAGEAVGPSFGGFGPPSQMRRSGEERRPGFGGPGRSPGFGEPVKPIKPFTQARWQSVSDQLSGKATGMELAEFGFGPRRGPDERGGFGPGTFVAPGIMQAMDADQDGSLKRLELTKGFEQWFKQWAKEGKVGMEELNNGLNTVLGPPPGFGPPGGPPSER